MSAVLIKIEVVGGSSDAATRSERSPSRQVKPERPAHPAHPAQLRLITPGTAAPTARETPSRAQPGKIHRPARPTAVPICPEDQLTLQVTAGAPLYGPGEIPVVRYALTNRSATTCKRDVGAAVQEALVFKGATRLWSSNDCWPGSEHRVAMLRPDRPERFVMRWSRKSSLPRCHGIRRVVPAGRYTLIGRVGDLMTRAPIRLR